MDAFEMRAGTPLEKELKHRLLPYRGQRLLLAFSGGLDSLVLGQTLFEVAPRLRIEWSVAHIDHGPTSDEAQRRFRDECVAKSVAQANVWNVPVHLRVATEALMDSEEAFRKFRYEMLEACRQNAGAAKIVTAHHRDDLLETRLLRLLRGTGPQGLQAMEFVSAHLLRPWLEITRAQIEEYARKHHLEEIVDPSNKNSTYLRNWVRNEWLPQLEAKQPGSSAALARSLEHVAALARAADRTPAEAPEMPWDRRQFKDLSACDRKAAVAGKLRDLGAKNFSQAHVEEIVKRLDTVQKRLDFVVAGTQWSLNAQQIHSGPI